MQNHFSVFSFWSWKHLTKKSKKKFEHFETIGNHKMYLKYKIRKWSMFPFENGLRVYWLTTWWYYHYRSSDAFVWECVGERYDRISSKRTNETSEMKSFTERWNWWCRCPKHSWHNYSSELYMPCTSQTNVYHTHWMRMSRCRCVCACVCTFGVCVYECAHVALSIAYTNILR